MSFSSREPSFNDGEPQELFLFQQGSTQYPYTSGASPITLDLIDYIPLAGLSRESIKRGNERSRSQLIVNVPRDTDFVQQFFGIPGQVPIWLYIYRIHEGETDYRIMWQGRIRSVAVRGEKATLTFDNIKASFKKQGLRYLYQGQCNNFTFDGNCGLSEGDFTHAAQEVLSVDDNVITVDNVEAAGWYIAGQVRRSDGESRMVMDDTKVGSTHTLTLLQAFEGLEVGEEVSLIGGACRHSFATCQAILVKSGDSPVDNSENYGGYPLVPRKNPFKSII